MIIIKCNVSRSRKTCITIQAFNVQDRIVSLASCIICCMTLVSGYTFNTYTIGTQVCYYIQVIYLYFVDKSNIVLHIYTSIYYVDMS